MEIFQSYDQSRDFSKIFTEIDIFENFDQNPVFPKV